MFDKINKLAQDVIKVAIACRRQHLAIEINSYLPVADEDSFRQLEAQVRVVRTLLKLRPSFSLQLRQALAELIRETHIVAGIIEEMA